MRQVQFEGHTLTIWEREDWQDPKLPVFSTNAFEWDTDTAAIHYTAAVDLPDGDPDELVPGKPPWYLVPPYLRRIQADYQLNRGYSIGYNWPVDYLGGIWEARGWDFECAANEGWNPRTWAILILVDGNDAPNELMLRSCRYLHAEAERLSNKVQLIRPHSQLGYIKATKTQVLYPWPGRQTACCGDGGRAKMLTPANIQGGWYNWRAGQTVPTPTPPIPTPIPPTPSYDEGDDMTIITNKEQFFTSPPKQWKALLLANGKLRHIPTTAEYYARMGIDSATGAKLPGTGAVEAAWTNAEIGAAGVV